MSVLLTLLLGITPAPAAELAGVALDDTVQLADQDLVLNGIGLREFLWIDIYVGALYLPAKTTDPEQAITVDAPKRIVMHFIFRKAPRDKVLATFRDGIAKQDNADQLADRLAGLEAMIDRDLVAGDRVLLDYVPGEGLTISLAGKPVGTIEGKDFMQAIWRIFLGDPPASRKLKEGMLGG